MSKPIICKKCGTVYTSAQTVCPNCMTRRPRTAEQIALGIALFFIFVGIISTMVGLLDDDSESGTLQTGNASRIAAEEETKYINIGETLVADGLEITLDEASDWSGNKFTKPKDGYKFIRAYFIIKNNNTADKYINPYDFTCYADNAKMEDNIWPDDRIDSGYISNGRNVQGYLYFEVPKNAQKIEIEYETDWWTDSKAYFKIK